MSEPSVALIHRRRLIMHDIPLTLTPELLLVRLTLPRDLTEAEAERLCGIIRSLAMPQQSGSSEAGEPRV
jgi:hypothetical protein